MSYQGRKKTFVNHKILCEIDRLAVKTGRAPAIRDVFCHVDVKTLQTIKKHIKEMSEEGLVEWDKASSAVWLTKRGKKLAQKLRGNENPGIYMPDDAMTSSGILKGDMLEIQKDFPICDGMLVAARVKGKLTCRKLSVQGKQFLLYAEDAPEDAIETSLKNIVGVVSKVQRLYYNFSA